MFGVAVAVFLVLLIGPLFVAVWLDDREKAKRAALPAVEQPLIEWTHHQFNAYYANLARFEQANGNTAQASRLYADASRHGYQAIQERSDQD